MLLEAYSPLGGSSQVRETLSLPEVRSLEQSYYLSSLFVNLGEGYCTTIGHDTSAGQHCLAHPTWRESGMSTVTISLMNYLSLSPFPKLPHRHACGKIVICARFPTHYLSGWSWPHSRTNL